MMRLFLGFPSRVGMMNKRDLTVEVPDSQLTGAKFTWIEPLPSGDVQGEVKRCASINGIVPTRIPGYWLLKEGWSESGIPPAKQDEKVAYHIHGGGFSVCGRAMFSICY